MVKNSLKVIGSPIVISKYYFLFEGLNYNDVFYVKENNQVVACKLRMINDNISVWSAKEQYLNQHKHTFYKTIDDCINEKNPLKVIRKDVVDVLKEIGIDVIDNKFIIGYQCTNCSIQPVMFSHNYLKISFDIYNGFSAEINRLYLNKVYFTEEDAKKNLKIEIITF